MIQKDSIIQESIAPVVVTALPNAAITVNPQTSVINLSWHATPSVSELTQSATLVSSLIQQQGLRYFMHDIRNINFANLELQRCLAGIFCPQLIEAGITKVVHLTQYAAPELIVIDRITDYVKNQVVGSRKIKFEICTSTEGAQSWLLNDVIITEKYTPTVATQTAPEAVAAAVVAPRVVSVKKTSNLGVTIKSYKERFALALKIIFKGKSALYAEM